MKKISSFLLLLLPLFAHAQWAPFGSGIPNGNFVIGLENYNNGIIAYTQPSAQPYSWDGNAWQPSLPALPDAAGIHKMKVLDGRLCALPYTATDSSYVFYLDNNSWQPLGAPFTLQRPGIKPNLYDIIFYRNQLYVSGEFDHAGDSAASGIARWNGTAWEAVGSGLEAGLLPDTTLMYPHQMYVFNNELLVAGNFAKAGGITVNGIAGWDGTSWHAMGNGFNRSVYCLQEYNGNLYAGGIFLASGSTQCRNIARWDGSAWVNAGFDLSSTMGSGYRSFAHSMLVSNSRLFIAGGFNRITQGSTVLTGGGIIAYDGTTVDILNGGVNSEVEAMFPYQNGLLAGGDFTIAGRSITVDKIALYTSPTLIPETHSAMLYIYPTVFSEVICLGGDINNIPSGSYRITDIKGQVLQQGALAQQIRTEALPPGMYLFQLFSNNRVLHTEKIVCATE